MTQAPRRLDADWLRERHLAQLLAVLNRDGEEARVVGGAVRNTLLGEPHGDIDIATTALPPEVVRRVEAAGLKAVPTGIEHGTITVIAGGRPFEVTTLREDVETFGRHAKVAFGRDWQRDAQRRDFTMNALSVDADGTLYDYVGGLADLKARRVRFIGDAGTRIAEDYLRILRFFRFHAVYGRGTPDPDGVRACIAGRAGIEQLSRERIRMEMLKLLLAEHAVPTLAVMTESGSARDRARRRAAACERQQHDQARACARLAADAVRRLGALGVSVVEDAERLRERLRLANAEYERIRAMADRWWRITSSWDERQARALLYELRPRTFHRPRHAGLEPLARRRGRCALARARDLAGALDGAGVSAQGGGLHDPRRRQGPAPGRGDAGGRGGMDRGGLSARCGGRRGNRRCRRTDKWGVKPRLA